MSHRVDTSRLRKRKDGRVAIPSPVRISSEIPLDRREGSLPWGRGLFLSGSGGSAIALRGSWRLTLGDPAFLVILLRCVRERVTAHVFQGHAALSACSLLEKRGAPEAVLQLRGSPSLAFGLVSLSVMVNRRRCLFPLSCGHLGRWPQPHFPLR